jgi:threonyl-tRNA synthetase
MLHTAAFGSIERFIGILTEHYAGAFPLWLAPVQVTVLPITDRAHEYAQAVADQLEALGFRVETDLRNEKIGYKIREAQLQKILYMLVLGDKETESGAVTVRARADGDLGSVSLADFIAGLTEERDLRS